MCSKRSVMGCAAKPLAGIRKKFFGGRRWPTARAFKKLRTAGSFSVDYAPAGIHPICPLVGALLWALGCGIQPAPHLPPPVAAPAVTIQLVDHKALVKLIAAQRGKVVVLDCWSTSCPPCVKDFPRLVALQKKWGPAVVCLSLSFDYEGIGTPEESLPRVQTFLTTVGAEQLINLLSHQDADTLYRQLDLVSVPAIYVYRADGTLAQRFDEDDAAKRLGRPFHYGDVEEVVQSLLSSLTQPAIAR